MIHIITVSETEYHVPLYNYNWIAKWLIVKPTADEPITISISTKMFNHNVYTIFNIFIL